MFHALQIKRQPEFLYTKTSHRVSDYTSEGDVFEATKGNKKHTFAPWYGCSCMKAETFGGIAH